MEDELYCPNCEHELDYYDDIYDYGLPSFMSSIYFPCPHCKAYLCCEKDQDPWRDEDSMSVYIV